MKKTLLLAAICCLSQFIYAQTSGSLDSTFGTNGRVVIRFDTIRAYVEQYRTRVAVQKDDKIIISGIHVAGRDTSNSFDRRDTIYGKLVRYNPNGAIDDTFGVNGVVITKTANGINSIDKIILQPDGKILVGGRSDKGEFTLIRYNSNGVLDATFNPMCAVKVTSGYVGNAGVTTIVIQPNGKIMLSGWATIFNNGYDDKLVTIRFDSNGYLDASFNLTGVRYERIETATASSQNSFGSFNDVQTDNKIILGGSFYNQTSFIASIIRYNLNGSIDSTFGINGRTNINGMFLYQLKVLNSGKIMVSGSSDSDTTLVKLFRLNTNGSLDTTFGIRGRIKTNNGDNITDFLIQKDEKILAITFSSNPNQNLTRFNSNGTLDSTFGVKGTIPMPALIVGKNRYYEKIEFQSSGKIIAAGRYPDFPPSRDYAYDNIIVLTRFNNSVHALNDTCQNAQLLTPSVSTSGTTANATSETTPNRVLPCETNQNVKDVWYRFRSDTGQLRAFRMQLMVNNLPASTPLKYAVYTGTCGDFVRIGACKSLIVNSQLLDTLTLLEANQDYFIRVWANDSNQIAVFTLKIQGIQNFNVVPIASFNTVNSCQSFASADVTTINSQKWLSLIDPTGVVAEMNPNGNLLGQVTGGYFINSTGTIRRASGTPYLDRNIGIKVVNQPTTDVSIRLYFTERERAAYFAIVGANPLAITHYAGASCSATVQSGSGDLFPAVIRITPSGNFYAEFVTRRFSGFFLGPNRGLVFSNEVNADADKLQIQAIYPTPVSAELTVVFTAHQATTQGRVFITGILGKTLVDKIINIQSGSNNLQLNTATLSNGLYFVNISDGVNQASKKVVKQ